MVELAILNLHDDVAKLELVGRHQVTVHACSRSGGCSIYVGSGR
jgi:hypothetical protein